MTKNVSINNVENEVEREENELIFPLEVFPTELHKSLSEVAENYHFSKNHIGTAVLTVAASIIGSKAYIQLKGSWSEPALIYAIIVGNSSVKKSPTLKYVMKPAWKIESDLNECYEHELGLFENETNQKNRLPAPKRKDFVISDTTKESLAKSLKNSPDGLLMFRDEATAWLSAMDQYKGGKGDEEQFWLSIFNAAPNKVTRASSDEYILSKDNTISVIGGMTPSKLKVFTENDRDTNGFIFRVLFALNEEMKCEQWNETELPEEVEKYWYNLALKLNDNMKSVNNQSGTSDSNKYTLDAEAKEIWRLFYNQYARFAYSSETDSERSLYRKMQAYCARFALVLHCLNQSSYNRKETREISVDAIKGAVKLTNFYKEMAFESKFLADSTPENIKKASMLYKSGKTQIEIAKEMVVDRATVTKWKNKYPEKFKK